MKMSWIAEKIFSSSITRHPSYHGWPTVANIGNDKLLAVCSGNREAHVCPFGRVFLYRSPDGGRSWTGPEALSTGPLDDRDSGICRAVDGSIVVNYFTNIAAFCGNNSEQWQAKAQDISLKTIVREHNFWMRRSTDNGKTWSEKYSIPVNNPHGPTLTKDGSLIIAGRQVSESPAYIFEGSRLGDSLAFARSVDNGITWEIISKIPAPEGHDSMKCFEPYALEAADGRIIVHIRDQNEFPVIATWQTESVDGGKNWSPPHRIADGYPSHLLNLPDGKILMTYGYRKSPFGIRFRISDDFARTWSKELILTDNAMNSDLGYPSTVLMSDGSLFTLWYEKDNKSAILKYCRWSLKAEDNIKKN
jgi:hypothetical protein